MSDKDWARLHRLYDPQDLIRDREIAGERKKGEQGPARSKLTEDDFYRRIDEGDRERDTQEP